MLQDDTEAMRKFNEQWDAQYSVDKNKPVIDGGGASGRNLLDSVQNQPITPMTQPYVPAVIPTTGDQCPQCNTMHPPIRPGEVCPVAKAAGTAPEVAQEVVPPTPAVAPLTEGDTKTEVKPVNEAPVRPTAAPPAPSPAPITETVSEPTPLAQNNIPTEIHVNKYLASWGDQIQAHCKANGIQNVKKLMRHITIEITDFLENYKGK